MAISLQVYEFPGGKILDDWTHRMIDNASVVTDNRGFNSLSASIQMNLETSFQFYERGPEYISVRANGQVVWEGRIEDKKIVDQGLSITAVGYWQSLSDAPYTALWSDSSASRWTVGTDDQNAVFTPAMFFIDTNNRLYIAPEKGATYMGGELGTLVYQAPDRGERQIVGIQFDFVFDAPADWEWRIETRDSSFAVTGTPYGLISLGAPIVGSVNKTFVGTDIMTLVLEDRGGPRTYTGETGAAFIKLTNVRLVTTTVNRVNTTLGTVVAAPGSVTVTPGSMANIYVGQRLFINEGITVNSESVIVTATTATTFTATFANTHLASDTVTAHITYADEIVKDLVSFISTLNSTQLSSSTDLIESPMNDLTDQLFEDQAPSEIIESLLLLGDNQTPPRRWEAGVFNEQKLHFRPRGSDAFEWFADVSLLLINRTITNLVNSTYATYKDENGRNLRTTINTDSNSVSAEGIARRNFINVDTTSATTAGIHRDALLDDGKEVTPRTEISLNSITDVSGAVAQLWLPRSGDTLTVRNLPPTLGTTVDRVRTFVIKRTEYNLMTNMLTPIPEEEESLLQVVVARRAVGIS